MAGLFALLYGLVWGGTKIYNSVSNTLENNSSRDEAIVKNKKYYIANGDFHYTETGEKIQKKYIPRLGHDAWVASSTYFTSNPRIVWDEEGEKQSALFKEYYERDLKRRNEYIENGKRRIRIKQREGGWEEYNLNILTWRVDPKPAWGASKLPELLHSPYSTPSYLYYDINADTEFMMVSKWRYENKEYDENDKEIYKETLCWRDKETGELRRMELSTAGDRTLYDHIVLNEYHKGDCWWGNDKSSWRKGETNAEYPFYVYDGEKSWVRRLYHILANDELHTIKEVKPSDVGL